MRPPPPTSTLFPYTTLFRSAVGIEEKHIGLAGLDADDVGAPRGAHDCVGNGGIGDQHILDVARQVDHTIRSEEHTSELQSPYDLVCRLLLEKKKKQKHETTQ